MNRVTWYRVAVLVVGPGGNKAEAEFKLSARSLREVAAQFDDFDGMEVVGVTEWDRY